MTRTRTAVPLAVAAGALVLSGAGGAVAGGMITGAQIKNGTVTGVDVKDRSLATADLSVPTRQALRGQRGPRGARGARGPAGPAGPTGSPGDDGVLGYQTVGNAETVPAGEEGNVYAPCPAGKKVLGGVAYHGSSSQAVQLFVPESGEYGTAYSEALPVEDTVVIRIFCARVS